MINYADLQLIEQMVILQARMCLSTDANETEQFLYGQERIFKILRDEYNPNDDPNPEPQNPDGSLNLEDYKGDVKTLVYSLYDNPTAPFAATGKQFNAHEEQVLKYWVKVSLTRALFERYNERADVELPKDNLKDIFENYLQPAWQALDNSVKNPGGWLQTHIAPNNRERVASGLGWASSLSWGVFKCSVVTTFISYMAGHITTRIIMAYDTNGDEIPQELYDRFYAILRVTGTVAVGSAVTALTSYASHWASGRLSNTAEFPVPEPNPKDLPSQYQEMFTLLYSDNAARQPTYPV